VAQVVLIFAAMNVGLYQAAAAMNSTARWQESISENLAASSIPGFKKQEVSFQAIQAGYMPSVQGLKAATMPNATGAVNFQQGELKQTGSPTDIAIEGRGFLEVQLPDGKTAYTRDGELRLSPTGQLTTKHGFSVMSDGGPVQFDISNPAPISISANGDITQGTDTKGKLKLVEFNEPQQLQPISQGLYLSNPNMISQEAGSTTVRQGFVENANTSASAEMANLIAAMRMYEANQRVVQAHDERMGRVLSDLGNIS
jgi:flagellar basal body rod protein FlgG